MLLLALSEQDYPQLVLWILGGLAALLYAVNNATEIWDRFRTKPPASEVFASKSEVADLREKLDGISGGKWATRDELREAHARIDGLNSSVKEMMDDLTAAIREDLAEHKKETHEISQGLTAIHRSIGLIEGQLRSQRTR